MLFAHIVTAGSNMCDFCSCLSVFKIYRCKNFELRGTPVFNKREGLWAACWMCSQLVDDKKWPALTEHAFQVFMKKHRVPRYEALQVREQFAEMVRLFSAHRLNDD